MVAGTKRHADQTPMALTLGVWLCTLPFVFLLIGPLLGWQAGLFVAGGVLAILSLICWTLCALRAGVPPDDRGATWRSCKSGISS